MKHIKGLQVLERQDFEKHCPSFYATAPRSDVSGQYAFLNTRDIAVQLWDAGWYPVKAQEQRSVKVENKGLTKHIIRWANPEYALNGERIELVGVNSHNTSAAFSFYAGVFRMVCLNGLISQTSNFGAFRIKHIGNIKEQVHEAIAGITDNAGKIAESVESMKAITLTPDEKGVYAATAHDYLYEGKAAPIKASRLLTVRRSVDRRDDLWTTFNVVQENVMKGGLRGQIRGERGEVKVRTTRAVKSIDRDVKLNKALWALTEKMAELKAA